MRENMSLNTKNYLFFKYFRKSEKSKRKKIIAEILKLRDFKIKTFHTNPLSIYENNLHPKELKKNEKN